MLSRVIVLAISAILLIHAPARAQTPTPDPVTEGLEISKRLCARCHAIDPAKPWDSIGSTPSFKLMAGKLEDYEPRLRSVTARRPHTGQELVVAVEEIEHIIAYIQSLNATQ